MITSVVQRRRPRRPVLVLMGAAVVAAGLFAAVALAALVTDTGDFDVTVADKGSSSGLVDLGNASVEYIGSSANNQSSGTGIFDPFVRLQADPTEQGFNTDAAVTLDAKSGKWTHAIKVNAIPVDAQGRPLRPCISWLDGRAWEEAQLVMRKLGGAKLFAVLVGVAMTGKDLLPKYLWLKRKEPDIYRQAAAIVDASGYLLGRATGRLVYEWSVASVTGLFNLKTKTWDTGLMRLFGMGIRRNIKILGFTP